MQASLLITWSNIGKHRQLAQQEIRKLLQRLDLTTRERDENLFISEAWQRQRQLYVFLVIIHQ